MSTEITVALIIGFAIDMDDLSMPFKVTLPQVSHVEDRYDQKTGEKLEAVTVVDSEEREAYVFEGEEYAEGTELTEAMEQHIRCRINPHGDFFSGDLQYSIQPVKTAGKPEMSIIEVLTFEAECLRIKRAFEKYGIHLGQPSVFALSSVQ